MSARRSFLNVASNAVVVAAFALGSSACAERDTGYIDLMTASAHPEKPPPMKMPGMPDMPAASLCVRAGDCMAPTPLCDLVAGNCVECLDDKSCVDPKHPSCNAGKCRECTLDSDCADPKKPLCHEPDGRCTECSTDADCTVGPARTCDVGPGNCVPLPPPPAPPP